LIKAVVFDMWNTIIPATIDFVRLRSLAKKQGMDLHEFIEKYENAVQVKKYKTFAQLKKDFFKAFSQSNNLILEEELYEVYFNRFDKIRFFGEVPAVLEKLKKKGYKLALLSNTENLYAPEIVKNLELKKYFDVICFSFEIGALKPSKVCFNRVLKKLKVKPENSLMVGDSLRSDMLGARDAGMHNCLINRSGKVIDIVKVHPEFEIRSMKDLPWVLGELNAKKTS
jgi:2-haloalkanoic acid dehalogenase type II